RVVPEPFDRLRNHLSKGSMSATLITFGTDITRAPMIVPVPPVTSSKAPGKKNLKFLFFYKCPDQ
ncbi:MAG: hypothetical protein MR911_04400, partial [Spirochaetia bacterium]|nr:hypothetical protein [Spirochaetia bacterium]